MDVKENKNKMNGEDNRGWGTWNFSSNSREKLQLLKSHFRCTSSNPNSCHNLNNGIWRVVIGEVISRNGMALQQTTKNFNLPSPTNDETSCTYVNDTLSVELEERGEVNISYNFQNLEESEEEEVGVNVKNQRNVTPSIPELIEKNPSEELKYGSSDEILETVGDVCDLLKKGPVKGLTEKLKGKELDYVLKAMKDNLSTEESIANLILSVCPPLEEDLLEQSRWAPVLYRKIVLPEVLERSQPVPRLLSSAISQLASSFPDACVQFLCIPLLISPFEQEESTGLSQPIVEILIKITEESLPLQQRILLFRSFFKGVAIREKSAIQENLFSILLMLAETQGAFVGADSEFLSNLIDWLEIASREHFSNIKFAKFLVATLKGIVQDVDSRKEGNVHYLSPESTLKLKSIISQNKTFFKKIAEKTLKSIC